MADKSKNVLITGSSGMLGNFVVKYLINNPLYNLYTVSRTNISYTNRQHVLLDITDEGLLMRLLKVVEPEIIIHCAALVDVNACESQREYAHTLHVKVTEWMCEFPSVNQFIYISTDSVFDGQRGNYSEMDSVNPLNYYAQTKLQGEEVVQRKAKWYAVLRTNIVGFHVPVKNSLFEWGFTSLRAGVVINGYENVYFNPLYGGYLASLINKILNNSLESGIYHLGSSTAISKYSFLKRIAECFGFEKDLINPVKLDSHSLHAVRPLNTVLSTRRITAEGFIMPDIEQSLQLLFEDFSKEYVYDKRI